MPSKRPAKTRRRRSGNVTPEIERWYEERDFDVLPEEPWRWRRIAPRPEGLTAAETQWADDLDDHLRDRAIHPFDNWHNEALCYFPEDMGRELPEEGAWVTILRPPHTAIEVPFGATYFAVPYRDGVKGWRERRYSVTAHTPEGELRLWPYEYAVLDPAELAGFVSEGQMEFLPGEGIDDAALTEKIFYLQTRGIPKGMAIALAIGDILAPVGHFVIAEASRTAPLAVLA